MTKFFDNREKFRRRQTGNVADQWNFEAELYLPGTPFAEMVSYLRVKRSLKRAVKKDFAPQYLIDSITNSIRR